MHHDRNTGTVTSWKIRGGRFARLVGSRTCLAGRKNATQELQSSSKGKCHDGPGGVTWVDVQASAEAGHWENIIDSNSEPQSVRDSLCSGELQLKVHNKYTRKYLWRRTQKGMQSVNKQLTNSAHTQDRVVKIQTNMPKPRQDTLQWLQDILHLILKSHGW